MHWLVCGETGTGKTTWAILRANEFFKKVIVKQKPEIPEKDRRKILILDPFEDERWPQHKDVLITTDRTQYLNWFWTYKNCLCIVDESAMMAKRFDDEMTKTAILGRHQDHLLVFLCQRVNQVNPTIRGQCSNLIVFGCNSEDAKTLAEARDCKELLQAPSMPDGTFIYLHRRGKPVKEKIF